MKIIPLPVEEYNRLPDGQYPEEPTQICVRPDIDNLSIFNRDHFTHYVVSSFHPWARENNLVFGHGYERDIGQCAKWCDMSKRHYYRCIAEKKEYEHDRWYRDEGSPDFDSLYKELGYTFIWYPVIHPVKYRISHDYTLISNTYVIYYGTPGRRTVKLPNGTNRFMDANDNIIERSMIIEKNRHM